MKILAIVLAAVLLRTATAFAQPLETSATWVDFGTVVGAATVERTITVTNRGAQSIRIRDVRLTPPLVVTRMKGTIAAGATSEITLGLGPKRPSGVFEGAASINYDGAAAPLELEARATFVPALAFEPRPELIAVASRGEEIRDSVEITSHLDHPVEITGGAVTNERWRTTLDTLEPGRRWRLSLVMTGQGPAGRRTEALTLRTSSPLVPAVDVRVRTSLRERVYTFPDKIDFGRIDAAALTPDKARQLDMSVMVYQKDGKDFQVKVSTDVPFLVLRPEKSTKFTDRWQIFCSVDPARLVAGHRGGSVTIETNDGQFPTVVVPVDVAVD